MTPLSPNRRERAFKRVLPEGRDETARGYVALVDGALDAYEAELAADLMRIANEVYADPMAFTGIEMLCASIRGALELPR